MSEIIKHLEKTGYRVMAEKLRVMTANTKFDVALRQLANDLEIRGLDYAIIGGFAVRQYNFIRYTEDIDVLMTPQAFLRFQSELIGKGYLRIGGTKRVFQIVTDHGKIRMDVLVSGTTEGKVVMPNPTRCRNQYQGIWYINLPKLILLKLGSGRIKDKLDVAELIRINHLNRKYLKTQDPNIKAVWEHLFDEQDKS